MNSLGAGHHGQLAGRCRTGRSPRSRLSSSQPPPQGRPGGRRCEVASPALTRQPLARILAPARRTGRTRTPQNLRMVGTERIRTQQRLRAGSPKLASDVYIDRKGVKRRTGPSASFALSSALGSPRSRPGFTTLATASESPSRRISGCGVPVSVERSCRSNRSVPPAAGSPRTTRAPHRPTPWSSCRSPRRRSSAVPASGPDVDDDRLRLRSVEQVVRIDDLDLDGDPRNDVVRQTDQLQRPAADRLTARRAVAARGGEEVRRGGAPLAVDVVDAGRVSRHGREYATGS